MSATPSSSAAAGISWRSTLAARYAEVRAHSLALARPLTAEDQVVQSMADASPTKWHLAHTTWFFETFLLQPFVPAYRVFDARYGFLFNSAARQARPIGRAHT